MTIFGRFKNIDLRKDRLSYGVDLKKDRPSYGANDCMFNFAFIEQMDESAEFDEHTLYAEYEGRWYIVKDYDTVRREVVLYIVGRISPEECSRFISSSKRLHRQLA